MALIHVAVGVITNPDTSKVLLSKRHVDSHQGGLWEYPGGKVESGESVESALSRELHEELAIEVTETAPLLVIEHDYGDKQVKLDVWHVRRFTGQEQSREGQPLCWVAAEDLDKLDFPAANDPITETVRALLSPQ